MLVLAYLARYAPGAPTWWLEGKTRRWVNRFRVAVSHVVDMELKKRG